MVGVNAIGYEGGNLGEGSVTDGRIAPWVQDVDDDPDGDQISVWANWKIAYRDILIVDGERHAVHVRNLSNLGLQNEANFCDVATIMAAVQEGDGRDAIDAMTLDGTCPDGIAFPQ